MKIIASSLLVLGLLAIQVSEANAVVCARGVYRAGCVGPHGAVGAHRPYGYGGAAVVRRPYGRGGSRLTDGGTPDLRGSDRLRSLQKGGVRPLLDRWGSVGLR